MVTTELHVDPGNLEQLAAWDGNEGSFWADNADTFERSIADFDHPFLDAAAIGVSDRVLDIGCGTGSSTRQAARRARAGSVLGVDLSCAMLTVARRRAMDLGLTNVSFRHADAQVHPFEAGTFDVAIGRTSVMFFADHVMALANIHRALVLGGRLALLVWQPPSRNEWFLELTTAMAAGRQLPRPPDGPHPFALADPDVIRQSVDAAGFAHVAVQGLDGSMVLGADPESAYDLAFGLLGWMLNGLDDDARRRAEQALRRTIEAHEQPDGVRFAAAVWLITARA
jgi:SAM-dependent methyltransferase